MKGKKTLRTITAAVLSGAVGLGFSGAAQAALKMVWAASPDAVSQTDLDGGKASHTYAKETLPSTSDPKSGYHKIDRLQYIAGPVKVTAEENDTYYVVYTLSGMVFAAAVQNADLMASGLAGSPTFSRNGGAKGDTQVAFRLTGGSLDHDDVAATDSYLTLRAMLALDADGMGSITRTITNNTVDIPGFTSTQTDTGTGIIRAMSALKETVTPATASVATAASNFMSFGTDEKLTAPIGSVAVGVQTLPETASDGTTTMTYLLNADAGDTNGRTLTPHTAKSDYVTTAGAPVANAADVRYLEQITSVAKDVDGNPANPVTFSGSSGFGFAKKVYLSTTATCQTGSEIRTPVTPSTTPVTYMDTTVAKEANDFVSASAARNLCVEVDGKTAIPASTYEVTTAYKGISGRLVKPMGRTHALGSIKRDGTQFNLPFLSTNNRFKQRITIQNRGSASTWSLTNLATKATSVAAKSGMDSGALPVGQTVLEVAELIEIMGGTRASGSITIPLPNTSVSAVMDIINPEHGGVGTTALRAE